MARPLTRLALSLVVIACGAGACGKGSAGTAPAASSSARAVTDAVAAGAQTGAPGEDAHIADLWTRAADGDADDLARLSERVGSDVLLESSMSPARRMTAIRALGYVDDFTALSFLAAVGATGTDEEASAALGSIALQAAQPRRATDPEDALEIHEGCARLLALAKDKTRPAPRRVLSIRALRLLSDRGWVPATDVPTDLDAR
jgi:hypothetical protein